MAKTQTNNKLATIERMIDEIYSALGNVYDLIEGNEAAYRAIRDIRAEIEEKFYEDK